MVSIYTIEKFLDEPIIYWWTSESCGVDEYPIIFDEIAAILDKADQPLVLINSALNISMTIDEVISTANLAARGVGSVFHHPNFREFIFITRNQLLQLAVEGLNSKLFGNVPTKVFETEEEAFAYARARIAER